MMRGIIYPLWWANQQENWTGELLGRACRGFHILAPSEDRFAGRSRFVQAADARGVRSVLDELRIFVGFGVDVTHRFDECIKIGTPHRLGRLDEHRSLDYEREVNRHRVE